MLEGGITEPPGFLAAGVRAGIKKRGLDLAIIASEDGPVVAAGAFTTNRVKGAPVILTQQHVKKGKLGAIVANSGVANVFTGKRGLRDAKEMAKVTAECLGLKPAEVGVASTGLIGAYLPIKKVLSGIRSAAQNLSPSREASLDAAKAIMTTDTFPKEIAVRVDLNGGTQVTIGGIAKGAGMICPKMKTATMLAFLTTDAAITPQALKHVLSRAVDKSFNLITVDNDTSTSDMVLVMANGRAGNKTITETNIDENFQSGMEYVTTELAWMIASDGEGASKSIEVCVLNARNEKDARIAARTVAGSNLVKAAIFGRDPNWGRIAAALGYSGAVFDPQKISITMQSERGTAELVKKGSPPRKKALLKAKDVMRAKEIEIIINLAAGKASAKAWGCDLTYDYVRVNSKYTT
ncbi:MAG: bifunctional ornithine acetyltransferase/N-acetylglutamate synthase [Candidatus Hadarchaeales archaeon]